MGAPLLIPAIGAAAGALMKPSNPLQGALLGAAAGYTGGQALGITGATTAASAATPVASAVTPAASASNALASQIASNRAASYAGQNILNAANAANTAGATNLAAMNAAGMSYGGRLPIDPTTINTTSAVNTTPSLLDQAGMYAKSAYENPVATGQTFGYANSLLQPDQQMASAPVVPVTARGQLKPFDPVAAMDPYKPSVIGSQQSNQFSLI
jgi:hypothetical protein